MEDYKKLLTDLYNTHDPERVKQIDYFLEKYKGKEKQFYTRQKENYENKKPVSDSEKIIEEALARIKSREGDSKTKAETKEKPLEFIEDAKPQAEDIQEIIAPKTIEEEIIVPPISEKPIEKKQEIAFNETEDNSREKDKFISDKYEPRTQYESSTPPLSKSKEDIKSRNKKPDLDFTSPQRVKEIRIKKKYFFSIFGMVLLSITLIVIVYFTFFNKPDNKARGVVKKPEGFNTEKTADLTPPTKTIPLETELDNENKEEPIITSETESKTLTNNGNDSINTLVIPPVEKSTKLSESETAEKPKQKPATSIWQKLFAKKKIPTKQAAKTEVITTEQKPSETISNTEPKAETEKLTVNEPEAEKVVVEKTTAKTVEQQPVLKSTDEYPIIEKKEIETQNNEPLEITPIETTGKRISKESLKLPAYFVACFAVKTEAQALIKMNYLKSKGFEASYYWIPDFASSGNPYFKVVIGPFSTSRDAYRKLTPVQERAEFDAEVILLK